ncbi:MAG: hypothetical protein Q8O87_04145 [bacterium]|nr:hypothetical protein [bacterium]
MNQFRKLALQRIANAAGTTASSTIASSRSYVNPYILKNAGILTNLVEKYFNISSFREKFLTTPAGPAREQLVYNEIIKRKPINLVNVSVPGPKGTIITYQVMPDYITIDGIRVPMTYKTAQKVADFFGMELPTSKMSKQIWQAADVKIRPTPLSAGGQIGKKYYSSTEVVEHKISDSDSSIAYSDMIRDEILKHKGPVNLVAGHMKDIIAPEGNNKGDRLGLFGWFGADGTPLEPSITTNHGADHTEYGAGVRLISGTLTITMPDGSKTVRKINDVLDDPAYYNTISNSKGYKRYN